MGGSVAFMLFASIWTLLAVAYLVLAPARFPAAAHKYAIAGVEFVTMVFWFAAFVAVASLGRQLVGRSWHLLELRCCCYCFRSFPLGHLCRYDHYGCAARPQLTKERPCASHGQRLSNGLP